MFSFDTLFQPISPQSLQKSFANKPTTNNPWPTKVSVPTKLPDTNSQPNLAPAKEQFKNDVIQG